MPSTQCPVLSTQGLIGQNESDRSQGLDKPTKPNPGFGRGWFFLGTEYWVLILFSPSAAAIPAVVAEPAWSSVRGHDRGP